MDYSLLLGVHDLDRAVEDAQQVLEVLKVAQVQVQVEEPQHLGADCWQTQVQVEEPQHLGADYWQAQVQVQVEEPQHLGADSWVVSKQIQVEDAQQSTSILTIDIGEILLA